MYHLFADVPSFLDPMNFFLFSLPVWVLFKMQQKNPPSSKSLGRFRIEFCTKHIQKGPKVNNRQFVKWLKPSMETAEWHQRGCSGYIIIKLKKIYIFFTISCLEKWIPDERLLFESLFPKQAVSKILKYWNSMNLGKGLLQIFGQNNWKNYERIYRYLIDDTLTAFSGRHTEFGAPFLLSLPQSRRGVNPNPILFYGKINFPLLLSQRLIA